MRAVGLLVGTLVLASCAGDPGVVAEQRTAIRSVGFDENDPRVTAPPVEPTVATPQPTTPPPTPTPRTSVPDVGVDEFAVWPEMLLLVDGDVPGWQIGSPSPQRSGADPYGDSDCPLLDLVRGVDTYDRLETAGRGAATFYNMVFETGSAAISEGLIDAVRGAPSMCPSFTDDRGMGWLEPLDVPSAGDWDAAGLAIGAGAEPVLIGYWANDGTIVKLRVVGPAAYSEFPALTQAVAAKLGAATTGPDEFDDPYEYDEFDDPWSDDAWLTHPLAGMILDESDLGADWWRWNVIVDEGTPAGAEELCGITAPAQPGGLSAWFEKGDDAVATQLVMNTTPDEAQQWLEVFRLLAACGGFDERSMRVTYELVPTSPDQVAGADDLVVLRSTVSDGDELTATMLTGGARVGGVVVQIVLAQYVDEPNPTAEAPSVDELLRLLQASLD